MVATQHQGCLCLSLCPHREQGKRLGWDTAGTGTEQRDAIPDSISMLRVLVEIAVAWRLAGH